MNNIIDTLVSDLQPVSVLKDKNLILRCIAGAVIAVTLIITAFDLRENLSSPMIMLPFFWKMGTFALFSILSLRALIVATIPGRQTDPFDYFILGAAVFALIFPALFVLWKQPLPMLIEGLNNPTVLYCFVGVAVSSIPGMIMAIAWVKKAKPLNPKKSFLWAGTAIGAMGASGYAFHCNQDHPLFVLFCYSAAMLIPAVITRLAMPLFLSDRNRPTS